MADGYDTTHEHDQPVAARETSLVFPVSVTGSDGGSPPSGVASYDIYASINGGAWKFWINVPASSPTANYTGQSNTTYAFYSIAHDLAGNTEVKQPAIEASTYVPDLTPPVTTVDATTGTNPSTLNTTTGTFTLNITGSDPGGGLITYFEVYRLDRWRCLPGGRPLCHPGRRGCQQWDLPFDRPLPGPHRRQFHGDSSDNNIMTLLGI